MIQKNNFYIITGGPGVGKTTLLEELKLRRYNYVEEVAREIIKKQIETNGNALPWMDTRKYSDMMLIESVNDFVRLSGYEDLLFFDRGIPDTYGYEKLIKLEIEDSLRNALQEYRYNSKVFILPPWKEIYKTDNERKQDFEEAVATYHILKEAYVELGYYPVDVPCLPAKERADYVITHISSPLK